MDPLPVFSVLEAREELVVTQELCPDVACLLSYRVHLMEELIVGNDFVYERQGGNQMELVNQRVPVRSTL
jgi:hypothetical protein